MPQGQQHIQPEHIHHSGMVHQPGMSHQHGVTYGAAHGGHIHDGSAPCPACNVGSIYEEAAAAPWSGSAPLAGYGHGGYAAGPLLGAAMPIKNWFAGGSLLFFDFEQESNRRLLLDDGMPTTTPLHSREVDPGSALGFETFIGRYFGCGKYAITGSYLFFNPDEESVITMPGMPGDYRAVFRNWDRLYIDRDGNGIADDYGVVGDPTDDHLYQVYDQAAVYRTRRDIQVQGLELNFVSFGIGGAARAGAFDGGCGTGACGPGGACGPCATNACGGMGGPMIPACNSRVQLQVSHGIRWFQFRDEFEFAASMANNGFGAGDDDFYYNVDVQNDLLGYQLGSRINCCVSRRVNVYGGAKFGIYGNNVDYTSRIGTATVAAQVNGFYPSMTGQRMDVSRNDTVLATLGELDLGVGIRLTNCWSVNGGYRLIGVSGVATSVGSIADDPAHIAQGHMNYLDDSLLLHGGYFGVNYNW
jgi:hypothetical protein